VAELFQVVTIDQQVCQKIAANPTAIAATHATDRSGEAIMRATTALTESIY